MRDTPTGDERLQDIVVLPAARGDLIAIGDFIAHDDPRRARSFVAEIEAMIVEQVAVRPQSFPARDDLAPGIRVASHRRYRIFFTVGETIEIVRVLHAARNLPNVFARPA